MKEQRIQRGKGKGSAVTEWQQATLWCVVLVGANSLALRELCAAAAANRRASNL